MNYGEKLTKLKDSLGIKHWVRYGEIVGVPGGWLSDQAKKNSVQTVDIPRLIKIAEYHQISLDYLLRNDITKDSFISGSKDLQDNDVLKMIEDIQEQLKDKDVKFNDFIMNQESKDIAFDSLDILKGIIKSNL